MAARNREIRERRKKRGHDGSGRAPTPSIPPITGVTISSRDFGMPVNDGAANAITPGPIYACNVNGITSNNVVIGGRTCNATCVEQR